jgi:hypothetical protein
MRKFLAFAILLSFVAPASANDYRPYFSHSAHYYEWRRSIAPKKILDSEVKDVKAQEAADAADKRAADSAKDKLNNAKSNITKAIDIARKTTPCGGGIC